VFDIGGTRVVDFNSVICPLAVVGDGGVSHAEILAEIDSIQDVAIVGTKLPGDISAEPAIASALFEARDVEAAWAAQDASPCPTLAAFDVLLGAPWSAPTEATLANAIALTPSMRFNELFGPRRYSASLPRMWLAWLGFAALGERLAKRPLGLQELTTLWSEQAPLMMVAARWDAALYFKPGPVELPNVDPGNLVRSLGQKLADNKKRSASLGRMIEDTMKHADAATRIAALRMAEPILRAATL
jgi:hypothetical protein